MAGRTNDSAGDGTTTAAVLAREIIHYGLQVLLLTPCRTIRMLFGSSGSTVWQSEMSGWVWNTSAAPLGRGVGVAAVVLAAVLIQL